MIAIEKNKKYKSVLLKLSSGLEVPKELKLKVEVKKNAGKIKK